MTKAEMNLTMMAQRVKDGRMLRMDLMELFCLGLRKSTDPPDDAGVAQMAFMLYYFYRTVVITSRESPISKQIRWVLVFPKVGKKVSNLWKKRRNKVPRPLIVNESETLF